MNANPTERTDLSKPSADGFIWPPRDPAGVAHTPASPPPDPALKGVDTLLDSIETDLLGRTMLAFDLWARRTGWTPDPPEASCWRCAGNVGPHECDGEGCADCRTKTLPWDRALRLGTYRERLQDEVIALKFSRWRPGGRGLGLFLGQVITREIQHAQIAPDQVRLVPIPIHPLRRIARGIDHTQVLARAASQESGCPVTRALRARHRPEQVGLSATARAANIRGAFEPSIRFKLAHRRDAHRHDGVRVWVLIDDVRTTGATFVAGSRALRTVLPKRTENEQKVEIWVCSVAVSGSRSRKDLCVGRGN